MCKKHEDSNAALKWDKIFSKHNTKDIAKVKQYYTQKIIKNSSINKIIMQLERKHKNKIQIKLVCSTLTRIDTTRAKTQGLGHEMLWKS